MPALRSIPFLQQQQHRIFSKLTVACHFRLHHPHLHHQLPLKTRPFQAKLSRESLLPLLQHQNSLTKTEKLATTRSRPRNEHRRRLSRSSKGYGLHRMNEINVCEEFSGCLHCIHECKVFEEFNRRLKAKIIGLSSRKRSFANSSVCHSRYISKDPISGSDRDVAQTDDETEILEEIGVGSLENNEIRDDLNEQREKEHFVVVNFYHFVDIDQPHNEVAKHLQYMQGKDIHGRIYINNQGINAQLSGPSDDALSYADWLKQDSRFSRLLVQVSPSPKGHAFPRLQLRYKPSLVQVEGGTDFLPLTDDKLRAVSLASQEWKDKLSLVAFSDASATSSTLEQWSSEASNAIVGNLASRIPRKVLLLDVRNGYEWDIGHFEGAIRPNVDCFKNTKFGLSDAEASLADPLEGIDKNEVEVLMYCTSGIRCDVYSVILRQRGFRHLYTLKGGISQYLKEKGPYKWLGNLFVFDSRLAVPPISFKSATMAEYDDEEAIDTVSGEICKSLKGPSNLNFARCKLCEESVTQICHRNCANLDCNSLYLSCEDCVDQFKGCCSGKCTTASRLRPVLSDKKSYHRYEKWHKYRAASKGPSKLSKYANEA